MRKIPLTQGKFALVDDEDYERIASKKWQALRSPRQRADAWYAVRKKRDADGTDRIIYMHREIMCAELMDTTQKRCVDHEDFDGLNNRKKNLRVCSYSENCRRRRKRRHCKSMFKGVCWAPQRNEWQARIVIVGRQRSLGSFKTEQDAAIAYNIAAQLFYGKFAYLNKV